MYRKGNLQGFKLSQQELLKADLMISLTTSFCIWKSLSSFLDEFVQQYLPRNMMKKYLLNILNNPLLWSFYGRQIDLNTQEFEQSNFVELSG